MKRQAQHDCGPLPKRQKVKNSLQLLMNAAGGGFGDAKLNPTDGLHSSSLLTPATEPAPNPASLLSTTPSPSTGPDPAETSTSALASVASTTPSPSSVPNPAIAAASTPASADIAQDGLFMADDDFTSVTPLLLDHTPSADGSSDRERRIFLLAPVSRPSEVFRTPSTRQQPNSHDCGLYASNTAVALLLNQPTPPEQSPTLRLNEIIALDALLEDTLSDLGHPLLGPPDSTFRDDLWEIIFAEDERAKSNLTGTKLSKGANLPAHASPNHTWLMFDGNIEEVDTACVWNNCVWDREPRNATEVVVNIFNLINPPVGISRAPLAYYMSRYSPECFEFNKPVRFVRSGVVSQVTTRSHKAWYNLASVVNNALPVLAHIPAPVGLGRFSPDQMAMLDMRFEEDRHVETLSAFLPAKAFILITVYSRKSSSRWIWSTMLSWIQSEHEERGWDFDEATADGIGTPDLGY
ncbi:hypothetical protein BDV96DRAFT_606734 [Lophiotrema nucula]|uniref:Uncharacterized protein n=1 Tax=Lophiotrema nucula TaxID=690887 RepID=A0A6A5YJJ6_9PLEO|nr:hypothetical protein BDV96DRAFT_606734 [Lophiotrema nucula]